MTDDDGKGIEFVSVRLLTPDSVFVGGSAMYSDERYKVTIEKSDALRAIFSALALAYVFLHNREDLVSFDRALGIISSFHGEKSPNFS